MLFDLQDDNTALHLAARNGHEKAVSALLDGGAKVDLVNKVSHECWHDLCCHGCSVSDDAFRVREAPL